MQPDYEYIAAREALMPDAEEIAIKEVGKRPAKGESPKEWRIRKDRAFLAAMDRLAREL